MIPLREAADVWAPMYGHGDRRVADRLLEALEAAADARNECLAFCLYQALLIELADRFPETRPSPGGTRPVGAGGYPARRLSRA